MTFYSPSRSYRGSTVSPVELAFFSFLLFTKKKITFHYDISPVFLIRTLTRKTKLWEHECWVNVPVPASADRGRCTRTFDLRAEVQAPPARPSSRSPFFSAWKGEATGRRWDVLNALIIVTASATSSLMWSRHLESVAHAASRGWRADWETASSENLQIAGPTSVSSPFFWGGGVSKDWKIL